jgi:transcriptional regulator NrdR family protein
MSLKIIKRDGDLVAFNPQKIYNRVKRSSKGLSVNSDEIFIKVMKLLHHIQEVIMTTQDWQRQLQFLHTIKKQTIVFHKL